MPGLDGQPPALPAFDQLILVEHERPGTDQAHLPSEHVEELRELIEGAATQEGTNTRDPRVGADLEQASLNLVESADLIFHPAPRLGPWCET